MRPDPLVPAFYYYKFAEAISAPYTSFDAYTAGAIDARGNIIKPESSISPFEYFVIKLKKIFEQLPYGTTKASLGSYIPALQHFTEEVEKYGITKEQFVFFVEGMVSANTNGELSYLELVEEMGSANLGGPASSAGYNTGGVSGIDKPMQKGVERRKSILGFEDSCEMFDVCPDEYQHFTSAKAWKDVPESETKKYLQRYQRRNSSGKMAVKNNETGEIHWLKLKPKSLQNEDVDLSIFKILFEESEYFSKILNEEEITPDKNLDGKTSTEEVLTYFQDKNKDGHPDGEYHAKLTQTVTNMFNVGSDPAKQKLGILQNETAAEGHHAEMHARLLSLGRGLDELHKIEDGEKRHKSLLNFLKSHTKGSTKSPSSPDRPRGHASEDSLPDTFVYDPHTGNTVRAEVKTQTASGSFPTKWPSFGKKLRKSEWAKEGIEPSDLEKTVGSRYRIKLPSEIAHELSVEAATQLVRYGKKSGPKTIIKAKDNNFYQLDTPDVMEHWASSVDYPSVKRKTRGKAQEQGNPESAGHTIELTPLKGFINKAIRQKSGTGASRITMSKKAYETIRSSVDPSLHEHLEKLILPHVKD